MVKIAIVYSTRRGNTQKLSQYIKIGIQQSKNTSVSVFNVADFKEEDWQTLHQMDAIIFGSPTYMGNVSAVFKGFIDESSHFWINQLWADKIAAGFTIGNSPSGDNLNTLNSLSLFAAQHGMIWVGQNQVGSLYTKDDKHINEAGSWLGLMATSDPDNPGSIRKGDQETAKLFGQRIADIAKRWIANPLDALDQNIAV